MLAIDEISMIPATILDLLDIVLKEVRRSSKPFGGVQIILFGDFLQLPPVSNQNQQQQFCFEAASWQEADIEIYCLREVFRQSDRIFVDLLNNMRFGKITEDDLELLTSRKNRIINSAIKPTIIGTHNYQIDQINKTELTKLPGVEYSFNMNASGKDDKIAFLKKNCLAPEQLILKIGAQVMMLKNTLAKEGIINGSLGVIKSFTSSGMPVVAFANGKTVTIEKEEWLVEEYNDEKMMIEVKARVSQIPLMLAWAITVHKSQGMTLDAALCDLDGAFAEGQIYVALSRVKSIEGLFLQSFNPKYIKINPKVVEFYKQLEIKNLVDS
jgi:ATP-dependent exoDNAse (exonuclease V) alpha subunit